MERRYALPVLFAMATLAGCALESPPRRPMSTMQAMRFSQSPVWLTICENHSRRKAGFL